MKKIKRILSNSIFISLSFFIPAFIIAIAYFIFGMYPFGDKSVLIMDMSDQYVEFFAGLRNIFMGGGSLFYSWGKTFGGGFLGIFAYYLSSPFSFITLLFNESAITEALLFINILKIGLAGLTFSIFLKYMYKRNDISLVIFSAAYALMSYNIVYSMDLMWLDGLIFAPIALIGVEELILKNKITVFSISLIFLFISNYYISYMVGIFLFIYFTYRTIILHEKLKFSEKFKKFSIFIGSALLALSCSAWLIMPTFYSLLDGKMKSGSDFSFQTLFNIGDLFTKQLVGSYDTITFGLPSIFCSMLVIVLVICYFTNRSFSFLEKSASAIVILFFLLSFLIKPLNMMWHAFQMPVWFPYRYSFLFCLFLIMLAYRAFTEIEHTEMRFAIIYLGIFTIALIFINTQNFSYINNRLVIISCSLVIVYFILANAYRYNKKVVKNIVLLSMSILISVEMGYNAVKMINGLDTEFRYKSRSSYTEYRKETGDIVNKIKSSDDGFYRIEKTYERSKNEAVGFGYRGITHYSSDYRTDANEFVKSLGMAQAHFWGGYYGSTILSDSLLNVKYVISESNVSKFYNVFYNNKDKTAYENPYVLPIAYLADEKIKDFTPSTDPFIAQNNYLNALSGENNNYFIPISEVEANYKNIKESFGGGAYTKTNSSSQAYIEYTFTVLNDNPIYAFFKSNNKKRAEIYINGSYAGLYNTTESYCIINVGSFDANQKVTIRLNLLENDVYIDNVFIYAFDINKFSESISKLKAGGLNISDFSDTRITGQVNAESKKLLYTTIPYEDGWKAYVDGKQVKTEKVNNLMLAVSLEPGNHQIVLKYIPKGFVCGAVISWLGIMILIALIVYPLKRQKINERCK